MSIYRNIYTYIYIYRERDMCVLNIFHRFSFVGFSSYSENRFESNFLIGGRV